MRPLSSASGKKEALIVVGLSPGIVVDAEGGVAKAEPLSELFSVGARGGGEGGEEREFRTKERAP